MEMNWARWKNFLAKGLFVPLVLAAPEGQVGAATREVCQPAGTCAYDTIQGAIDAAAGTGDIVEVDDGTYVERIDFKGKAIIVRSVNGADKTIIDGNESGSVVTFALGEDRNSVLDGFTITKGGRAAYGGGIRIVFSGPEIRNCKISKSSAFVGMGGGIYYKNSSANIALLIENCLINENVAISGGGIFVDGPVTIEDSTIIGNSATEDNGRGGGLYVAGDGPAFINKSYIGSNSAADSGGGIFHVGKALTIEKSHINNNTAKWFGGGISHTGIYDNSLVVRDSRVQGNSAYTEGGGIYCGENRSALINVIVSGNKASSGAGIRYQSYLRDNHAITNSTISGNVARDSYGGIVVSGHVGRVGMVNSIIWNNFPTETDGRAVVRYSCIKGGYPGEGNIDKDPRFIDPRPYRDAPTSEGDYHLQPDSPCIDAGTSDKAAYPTLPDDDIDGQPRPHGKGYDMGADEFVPASVTLLAHAGPDQIVCANVCDTVVLDGRKSSSSGIEIVSYDWELHHRDNAPDDRTAVGKVPTIQGLQPGVYDVVLTVTASNGATASDTMILTVKANCNCTTIMKGDLDGDGDVDGNDLTIFSTYFGTEILTP